MMGEFAPNRSYGVDRDDARYRSSFRVGGVSVALNGSCSDDVALLSSLEPFRVESGACNVEIQVDWVAAIPQRVGLSAFDSGSTWELSVRGEEFQFDFNAAVFGSKSFKRLLIDRAFRQATLQLSEECLADFPFGVEPLGYPLDELLIMHRLTQEKAIELHSTGIVRRNGDANLFVGHSGAGKSTTTRLWTVREDVEVLSDDRIIVRRDDSSPHSPEAETPHEAAAAACGRGTVRPRDRSGTATGHSAQEERKKGMRMYGTPWHGEAMYASPNSAPLTRIFVLEHGHGNVITPLTSSQAVAELFARSFVPFHRHEYVESALTFLEEVVDSIPVYRYDFEPDERAVEKIIHFHD